jgi:hypothetical protein
MSMMPPPILLVSMTVTGWRPITDNRGWAVIDNWWWIIVNNRWRVMVNHRSTGTSVIIVIQESIANYGNT